MAVQYVKPPQTDSKKYRILRASTYGLSPGSSGRSGHSGRSGRSGSGGLIFRRLTVVWVQNNGVPFNTTGFFARLIRNGRIVSVAFFDNFGVVRFNNIRTLTNVSFTLQTFNRNGVLFRTRTIPAGVEAFAIIG
jgi:hypothetical protein